MRHHAVVGRAGHNRELERHVELVGLGLPERLAWEAPEPWDTEVRVQLELQLKVPAQAGQGESESKPRLWALVMRCPRGRSRPRTRTA